MEARAIAERLPTGVPGLDFVLEGGLLAGGVYIVEGPPGAGKTILGNQFCFARAAAGDRTVFLTLLAEADSRMIGHMRRMRFFRPDHVPDRVYYVGAFAILEEGGLEGLARMLHSTITERETSLVVIDGVVTTEAFAGSELELKKFMREVQMIAAMTNCALVLLVSTGTERTPRAAYTMVDGIIELSDEIADPMPLRRLTVHKLRGSAPVRGRHSMGITDAGIVVYPRAETRAEAASLEPMPASVPGGRLGFDLPELDAMLQGGLAEGSVTMLLGPTGSGKTILGLQFLAAGVHRNEPCVCFGFCERPDELVEKSRRLGLGLEHGVERGIVELLWQPPIEAVIDSLGERLFEAVERLKVKRLFIDGMHGFQLAARSTQRLRSALSAFTERLSHGGVTTLYSMETLELFGPTLRVPIAGISGVTHNIVLLRHVELRARLHRLVSILKLRHGGYESKIREFKITDTGIEVADTFESAGAILSGLARPSSGNNATAGLLDEREPGQGEGREPRRR